MPTPKNAAAAPPVAPNPIPASHSRGDLADSPCHPSSRVAGKGPVSRVLSHIRPARTHRAQAGGHRQRLIVDRLARVGPKNCADRARKPNNQSEALGDVSLAQVGDGSGDGDEKHGRDSGADRRVSGEIKTGRQNRDGNSCATRADETNQEPDQECDGGELTDDQEIL